MLTLNSPAKINLFLKIIQRRPDGYHDLASLFQAIDLCDILHFKIAFKDRVTCSNDLLSVGKDNLVVKAVELFRSKTGINQYFDIHLEKKIPLQAGLGGGSSNAATTLWALNSLCGNPASTLELATWGAEIGSDISFFLSSGTAYCTGRGEVFREQPSLKKKSLQIIKPAKGLSTAKVFQNLDVALLSKRDPEKALASFFDLEKAEYFNDLEVSAFDVMPELKTFKEKLFKLGFSTVLMSGSGSSFFCIGDKDLSSFSCDFASQAQFVNRRRDCWY